MVASREILTGVFNYFVVPCRRAALSTSGTAAGCAAARRAFDSAILSELVGATLATVRLRFFPMAVSERRPPKHSGCDRCFEAGPQNQQRPIRDDGLSTVETYHQHSPSA